MLVFEERGKPEYPEKAETSRSRVKNQQTQPTYDAECGNRTRDTLVEGERSHHCANPAPLKFCDRRIRGDLSSYSVNNGIRGVFVVPVSLFKHEGVLRVAIV